MKHCLCCGRPLVKISTKTAIYKGVCLDCEITYKIMTEASGREYVKSRTSTASQITEAAISV